MTIDSLFLKDLGYDVFIQYLKMGRRSTGAWTTDECLRLELPFLWKNGYFKAGSLIQGSISWTNDSQVNFTSSYIEKEKWLRLYYTIEDKQIGKKHNYDVTIQLCEVPSNLGKGMIPYFLCPVLGKRCRVLYQAYGYHEWKCREAYQSRIFYPSQICSKMDYANNCYWAIQNRIDKLLGKKYKKFTYSGKPTKFSKLLERLCIERNHWDIERWKLKNLHISIREQLCGHADDESIIN